MKSKQLYQPFELYVSDLECWQERTLVYHFFEIVQIMEGHGTRIVNQNEFSYSKGSIFIFTPLDCRGFVSQTPTRFCSIRFSEVFLGECKSAEERAHVTTWLQQLEHIFFHQNRFQEVLIKNQNDCTLISTLISNLIEEYEHKPAFYQENLKHFVTLILNILARNVSSVPFPDSAANVNEPLINQILVHIHAQISNPEKLKIDYLALRFKLSANYVGEYFKKITGESLQHYIMQYKIKLVQQRLVHSSFTVSQIAHELGFADESYLSKQFRKHIGMSPSAFRKKARSDNQ